MTPEVEKIINDYLNSPTGKIRQVYPVVEKIDLKYYTNPAAEKSYYRGAPIMSDAWLGINVYLNSPIDMVEDLWDTHNFDWGWMMDHHITGDVVKLFGGKKLPYDLKVYAPRDEEDYDSMLRVNSPEDSHWKYITGTGGLTW